MLHPLFLQGAQQGGLGELAIYVTSPMFYTQWQELDVQAVAGDLVP